MGEAPLSGYQFVLVSLGIVYLRCVLVDVCSCCCCCEMIATALVDFAAEVVVVVESVD